MSNANAVSDLERAEHNGTFGVKKVAVYNDDGAGNLSLQPKTATEETLQAVAGLVPDAYDYISLSYTGSNLTGVVFKTGGSGGTTVATLTLVYDGSDNLTSVTKT